MLLRKQNLNKIRIIFAIILLPLWTLAQNNGNDLTFQGLGNENIIGVKALGMGGAYTAVSGDLDALFHNPAGIAGINEIKISFSLKSNNIKWQENQEWWSSRYAMSLPYILTGAYTPGPAWDGVWMCDSIRRPIEVIDGDTKYEYIFNPDSLELPPIGVDEYSEEDADWQKEGNSLPFNHFALAIPFGKKLVLAASFNRKFDIYDYDRNDTYLSPHFGYQNSPEMKYHIENKDTLNMEWYQFERTRKGGIYSITGALAYKLNDNINIGIGMNYLSGKTEDSQEFIKKGEFDILFGKANGYRAFVNAGKSSGVVMSGSDTLDVIGEADKLVGIGNGTVVSGDSKYSGMNFNIGLNLSYDRFNFGLNIKTPYTMKRDWDYVVVDGANIYPKAYSLDSLDVDMPTSGIDELKIPLCYSIGLSVRPIDKFRLALDMEYNPYSKAEFDFDYQDQDSTHHDWVDQMIIRFGIEYKLRENISILAGYSTVPQVFVPNGAAYRDEGPSAESYTFGISLGVLFGRLDVVYEHRILKYYDTYEISQNYAMEKNKNIIFGYTIGF